MESVSGADAAATNSVVAKAAAKQRIAKYLNVRITMGAAQVRSP
jgi:hypothetical protein